MTHLGYLDGWRGLAIAFLLIGHFFPVPGINLGHVGVNLFFVLSGLLMARLLFLKQVPFDQFYRRRIARVFPTAYCFVIALVLINIASGSEIGWGEVAAAASFTNNYWSVDGGDATLPFGHLWSLSVEEHSYVLLSLIAFAGRRRWLNAKWLVAACVLIFASMGLYYWTRYTGKQLYARSLHTEVAAFGVFASAFLAIHFSDRRLPRISTLLVPFLFTIGIAAHWWSVPSPLRMVIGVGCFSLAVNILDGAHATIHRVLSVRPLRQLGLWSFSLYVWQQPFYLMVEHQGMNPWGGLSLGLLCGLASFYIIEDPLRIWLNRRWSGGAASATSEPVVTNDQVSAAGSAGLPRCR